MRTNLVSVATYANPVGAEMACEFLKANGIDAEIERGVAPDALGLGNPLTVQTLFVTAARVTEARALLATHAPVEPAETTADAPAAGSTGKRFDRYFERDWNERERAAESAYRASVIGLFLPFVSWWAAWKLCQVVTGREPLNPRCARRAKIAGAVMILPAFAWTLFLVTMISPP